MFYTVFSRSIIYNLSPLDALWKHLSKKRDAKFIQSRHVDQVQDQGEIILSSIHFQVRAVRKSCLKKVTVGSFLSTDEKEKFSDFEHPAVIGLFHKCGLWKSISIQRCPKESLSTDFSLSLLCFCSCTS